MFNSTHVINSKEIINGTLIKKERMCIVSDDHCIDKKTIQREVYMPTS